MKYKVGDKFLEEIVITEIIEGRSPYCVKARGINAGCVSEKLLDSLRRPDDMTAKEVWNVAEKLALMDCEDTMEAFGTMNDKEIFEKYTPQEAAAKIKAWEESKKIEVGDFVECGSNKYVGVMTANIDDDGFYVLCEDGITYAWGKGQVKKTGRHIDIEGLLAQIRGAE